MANEGTYPYMGGGVSTWCHILCENLEDIDWKIFAVVADPYVTDRYKTDQLPQIKEKIIIPLWGFEETAEYTDTRPFPQIYDNKVRTTNDAIETEFVALFESFLSGMDEDDHSMIEMGHVITSIHDYFQNYDYNITMKSELAWNTFKNYFLKRASEQEMIKLDPPSLFDLTTCMRWLYNMFVPVVANVPVTDITHATIASSTAMACIISKVKYGTPMVLTDHGVYARERYIACSSAPFSSFCKRFLARLALLFSKLCYYYADVITPCAHFNARWELPLGGYASRLEINNFKEWENTGVVPNLKEFPHLEPCYRALVDYNLIPSYDSQTEFPWIRTIYNGVDTDRFKPGPKPEHLRGTPTAVALARVFPLKDVLTMIRSCKVAKQSIDNIKYIVYGSLKADPEYVQKCNDLIAELKLEDNFDLAGYHSKPNEAFWEGDVSVLSSISEGFPFTVLESMAAGVPVVGTDVGGCKEAIGIGDAACGIVVPPRDPESFGNAVVKLLTDSDLRLYYSKKGRERVLKLFQTDISVKAYRNVYQYLYERFSKSRNNK